MELHINFDEVANSKCQAISGSAGAHMVDNIQFKYIYKSIVVHKYCRKRTDVPNMFALHNGKFV